MAGKGTMSLLAGASGSPGLVTIAFADEATETYSRIYLPPDGAQHLAEEILRAVDEARAGMDATVDELEMFANQNGSL